MLTDKRAHAANTIAWKSPMDKDKWVRKWILHKCNSHKCIFGSFSTFFLFSWVSKCARMILSSVLPPSHGACIQLGMLLIEETGSTEYKNLDIYTMLLLFKGTLFHWKGAEPLVNRPVNVSCFLCLYVPVLIIVTVDLSEKHLNMFLEDATGL